MYARATLKLANHLLSGEAWARHRLQPFSGLSARLEFGSLIVPIAINSAGLLEAGDGSAQAAVSIRLPGNVPLRILTEGQSVLQAAHITGAADFAEALGFVFRNLRWDAEDDLSRLIGDVAAHRLVQGGKRIAAWHLAAAKNLASNVAEYLTEEDRSVPRRAEVVKFCTAVDSLRSDFVQIEERLERLTGH
jgi:ubiquinone biosynthesis accessory factor UbiJ